MQYRLKRRYISTEPHGVISQNMVILNLLLTIESSVYRDATVSLWTASTISITDLIRSFLSENM
jgi:hypothetical protein